MNEFEFERLLELYKKDRLTPEEKKMLDEWFQQLDMGADAPLTDADKNRLKSNILNKVRETSDQENSESGFSQRTWLKIAASISIVFLIGFIAWRVAFTPEIKTYASDGTTKKITLSDGSLVWLKGNSTLKAPAAFDSETRGIILEGEALFEVAKDPKHPFVIQCGQVTTTVLGTSFNLKSLSGSVELTVLTGKVSLNSDHDKNGVVVMPNEKVIYDAEKSLVSSQKIVAEEKAASTEGTEYDMSFSDASLNNVFSRIEKKFDVKVSVSNEGLRNCIIRADFSDQSLEKTLDMICQSLDFRYTIDGNKVLVAGEKCN